MQMDGAIAVARLLQREERIGSVLCEADLDDMAVVLGRRPRDREEGLAAVGKLVQNDPGAHLAALVSMFGRIERRREHLWAPLMVAQESAPFERLAPELTSRNM
jgi:hypothetical protein